MKKMAKKWDLETSNVETELKIGIYAKNWAKQVLLKNFDQVKVNGQLLMCADVAWVTSPRADVAGREATAGACGAWVRVDWRVWGAWGAWQVQAARMCAVQAKEVNYKNSILG